MEAPGRKDDTGKRRYELLFAGKLGEAVEEVVKALEWGANHYGDQNWERVENHRPRYFGAACRHIFSWYRGERNASDSGVHHLACAVASLLFLMARDATAQELVTKADLVAAMRAARAELVESTVEDDVGSRIDSACEIINKALKAAGYT